MGNLIRFPQERCQDFGVRVEHSDPCMILILPMLRIDTDRKVRAIIDNLRNVITKGPTP